MCGYMSPRYAYPMATWLDQHVPVDEITARARQVRPGRMLATFILGFFFLLGWIPGRMWYLAADCVTAVSIGFRRGAKLPARPVPEQPGTG